jgi:hypothetical protein
MVVGTLVVSLTGRLEVVKLSPVIISLVTISVAPSVTIVPEVVV